MRITILTESLGSGGAERQVCTLAGEFRRRHHEVRVVTYAFGDFYRRLLADADVEHIALGGSGKLSWALRVRRFLRGARQDVVVAFLSGPSAYAELAGIPSRNWGLVVSERSIVARRRVDVKRMLHGLADYVVTNSHSTRLRLEESGSVPSRKLVTIYNAVRIDDRQDRLVERPGPKGLQLIVAARVSSQKNVQGLIRGLRSLKETHGGGSLSVHWYGRGDTEPGFFEWVCSEVHSFGLEETIQFFPPTSQIHAVMREADAVLLPSFYEGLPNSVCEAMMLGKPILMSAVCDAGNLVDMSNGFLFDPASPASIAEALGAFSRLDPGARAAMGEASRQKAERLFDLETVCNRFLMVLEAAAGRERVAVEHWPTSIPETVRTRIQERQSSQALRSH